MASHTESLICLKVVLALSDAPGWCLELNDLNFHDLYNLVIDFEDVRNPAKKAKRQDQLKWWNKYVFTRILADSTKMLDHIRNGKASGQGTDLFEPLGDILVCSRRTVIC
jgi:VanZ family protein